MERNGTQFGMDQKAFMSAVWSDDFLSFEKLIVTGFLPYHVKEQIKINQSRNDQNKCFVEITDLK